MNTWKFGISTLVVLTFITFLFYKYDIKFFNKHVENEGMIFSNIDDSEKLRNKLDMEGISYSIRNNEENVEVLWNKEDANRKGVRDLAKSDLMPDGMTGLCFSSSSDENVKSLINILNSNSIDHSVVEKDEEMCLRWLKDVDLELQKLYPNLKQIRTHQLSVQDEMKEVNN